MHWSEIFRSWRKVNAKSFHFTPILGSLANNDTHMAPPTSSPPPTDADSWAVDRAVSLLEAWALNATSSGLVGAWQLLGVCRAARTGAR
jgi:hypothetical protein